MIVTPGRAGVIWSRDGARPVAALGTIPLTEGAGRRPVRWVALFHAGRAGRLVYIEILSTTENFGTVVIDDFHALDNNTLATSRTSSSDSPTPRRERSKLIIVGINRAGDSLIEHAPDLANRLDTIRFEVEPDHKVSELVTAGEEALNIEIRGQAEDHRGRAGEAFTWGSSCATRSARAAGDY